MNFSFSYMLCYKRLLLQLLLLKLVAVECLKPVWNCETICRFLSFASLLNRTDEFNINALQRILQSSIASSARSINLKACSLIEHIFSSKILSFNIILKFLNFIIEQ
jgi:hypothetical protein